MASSVSKHPTGSWCFSFYSSGKKPARKWFYFPPDQFTKKQVKEIRDQYNYKYKQGEFDPWGGKPKAIESIPINQAKKKYLKHIKKELAPSTIETASGYLSVFCERFGKIQCSGLSANDLSDFVNSYENYNTRRTVHYVLQRFFDWTSTRGYSEKKDIRLASTTQEKKHRSKNIITSSQLPKLLEGFDKVRDEYLQRPHIREKQIRDVYTRYKEMSIVLFYMGLRLNDIIHARPAWILNDYTLLRIGDLRQWKLKDEYRPKSQKEFDPPIVIPKEVTEIFKRRSAGKFERLFNVKTYKRYQEAFKKASIKAFSKNFSKDFTPHSLRHSCATYWLNERKVPVQEVQRLMRHEDINTTMRYYHPSTEAHLEAFL